MATILVIEDEAVIREPIALSLRANGHHAFCAEDGRAALAYLQSHIPDLILLDIKMPAMDGISLLRELRANDSTVAVPVLLLSNATDKCQILQAAKLGVQGYVLKATFSMDDLLERVRRISSPSEPLEKAKPASPKSASGNTQSASISPSSNPLAKRTILGAKPHAVKIPLKSDWPQILTREQTIARLELVASGKTIAGVVAQLIAVTNSARADMSDVVRVIQSDPVLAVKVLQLANSASSGTRGRVRTIEEAARNLGVRGIQNLAVSVGIAGVFPPDEQDGFDTVRCWQHSYAVAELFNRLVRDSNPEKEGMNHLIGLCHDLGEILLRQHFAPEYSQILAFALANCLPFQQIESSALGIRHSELISRLLTQIGLPAPAVQGIRDFHEHGAQERAADMNAQNQALTWANLAAHGLLLTPSAQEKVRPITRSEWVQFGASERPPSFDIATIRNEILLATSILARLPDVEEKRLLCPLIPRHTKRVWYVRPESFIEFDPLGFALTLCCDVTIAANLPTDEMWREIDALILVGIRPGIQGIVPSELTNKVIAAGRNDLPILCLVSQNHPLTVDGTVLTRSFPVSLDELNKWLSSGSINEGSL